MGLVCRLIRDENPKKRGASALPLMVEEESKKQNDQISKPKATNCYNMGTLGALQSV